MGLLPFPGSSRSPFLHFFLIAMSRLFRRTVVLDVSGFSEERDINYIAEKICSTFSVGDVVSIQFMPGKSVRVSFKDESIKTTVLSNDSLSVDGVPCPVRGGGPRPENVLIFRCPFEVEHSVLKEVMSQYGTVHGIQHRSWLHLDGVMDGSRVVRMTRARGISRTILVKDHQCKVWYKGMPISCDICSGSHKAQDCPYKGVCMRCRQPGHVQRDCTNAPNAWGTSGSGVDAAANPDPAEAQMEASASPLLFSSPSDLPPTGSSVSEATPPSTESVVVSTGEDAPGSGDVTCAAGSRSLPSWGSASDLSASELPPCSADDDLVRASGLGSDHMFSPLSDVDISSELESNDGSKSNVKVPQINSSISSVNPSDSSVKEPPSGGILNNGGKTGEDAIERNDISVSSQNGDNLNNVKGNTVKPLDNGNLVNAANKGAAKSTENSAKKLQNVKKPPSGGTSCKVAENTGVRRKGTVASGGTDGLVSSGVPPSSESVEPLEVDMVEVSTPRKRGCDSVETSSDSSSVTPSRKALTKVAKKSGAAPSSAKSKTRASADTVKSAKHEGLPDVSVSLPQRKART